MLTVGKHNDIKDSEFDAKELKRGIEVEMEHTDDPEVARAISKDHLMELKNYYTLLDEMEEKGKRMNKEKTAGKAEQESIKDQLDVCYEEMGQISDRMFEAKEENDPEAYSDGKKAWSTCQKNIEKLESELEHFYEKKASTKKLSIPDQHQLRILKDTVRNPAKGFIGGPTAKESEKILREKFHYTDSQISNLKTASISARLEVVAYLLNN